MRRLLSKPSSFPFWLCYIANSVLIYSHVNSIPRFAMCLARRKNTGFGKKSILKKIYTWQFIRQIRLLFLYFFIALLAGCTTYHAKHDGPPNFYVDVSKIPDAVPKIEPPCRFANKPYRVNGHTYRVLSSSEGYDKRGIASWYGTLFHKHRTSCGESYNMLSMTAASTILPLPTYAQVTNLKNGKRIIVKVNDRGPFAEHRIMDLSWAAAKKLGITGPGTGYVEVKAIDPRTWHKNPSHYTDMPKPKLARPGQPILYLQVGALSQLSKARALGHRVAEFTHRSVRIQKKGGLTPLYRVQIGPLSGVEESDRLTKKLENAGFGVPMPVII